MLAETHLFFRPKGPEDDSYITVSYVNFRGDVITECQVLVKKRHLSLFRVDFFQLDLLAITCIYVLMFILLQCQILKTAHASRKQVRVTNTPLTPHFYIVKLGFTGVYMFFLFLLQTIDCGYSLEPPQ